jgi:hypothetical protein
VFARPRRCGDRGEYCGLEGAQGTAGLTGTGGNGKLTARCRCPPAARIGRLVPAAVPQAQAGGEAGFASGCWRAGAGRRGVAPRAPRLRRAVRGRRIGATGRWRAIAAIATRCRLAASWAGCGIARARARGARTMQFRCAVHRPIDAAASVGTGRVQRVPITTVGCTAVTG